jgi:gluconate 2-dehydrogenase gamma chain
MRRKHDATHTARTQSDRRISRRELFKRVSAVGAASVVPVPTGLLAQQPSPPAAPAPGQTAAAASAREAFETLTASESDTLEAFVARLIPTDENGPGAAEARAAHYIDRALAGPLASFREAYSAGLAALDGYAQVSKGAPFAKLSPSDQDDVLTRVEKNEAPGFKDSATFFTLIRRHTIEGTFCDPYYGGNANFVGWDLIGYPGVRLAVTVDQQQLGVKVPPNHRSAYDFAMFSKSKPPMSGAGDPPHDH